MRFLRLMLCLAIPVSMVAAASEVAPGPLDWPAITAQTKPWSRWWWLGNIGTKHDFTVQMERYAAAGLGGLEITPIYGVRGEESRFKSYLSPQWMEQLDHVLDEGQRLGLGIDMATGNGWPFGGPWVTPDFSARTLVTRSFTLKPGTRLQEPVTATDAPVVRVAGPRQVTIGELKDPVAANANLQDLALDQVRFPRPLPLQVLMAYSAAGEKVDLTGRVGRDGRLDWVAPAAGGDGPWTLYAVFLGWHGKQVERAGPGGEGDVIDHFSADALARYLKHFDEAYAGHRANRLRAYFNDSYEVDDASGESNWTPAFFDEFRRRRGYDLRDELPALLGKDTADKNARVISDHRETISDLLLENFTQRWAKWAAGHGALIRNQAHGSPANILDLYAASGIPETEGANPVGMKLASSAAHVTGKTLASSETATWLGEHWQATLAGIKQRVDLMFLGGVNHQCYHGTAFSPPDEPWPGFHFYASIEMDPSSSIWHDADVLNGYVARVQSFLQAGQPANDILLYYPLHDTWAQRGDGAMPHFGGGGPRGPGNLAAGQELFAAGYTFDWISDRLLAGVTASGGALETGGNRYRVVLVPAVTLMPVETLERLWALAEAGATVVFQHGAPTDVPGLGHLAERRARFQTRIATLGRAQPDREGVAVVTAGRGRFLLGDDLNRLLSRAGVQRERLVEQGLSFERRRDAAGTTYFLLNRGEKPFAGWMPLAVPARAVALFDPATGTRGLTPHRSAGEGTEVYLRLPAGHSLLLRAFAANVSGPAFQWWDSHGAAKAVAGPWRVTFVEGGPALPATPTSTGAPQPWTSFDGPAYGAFAGTATYATTFAHPTDAATAWALDLGNVADSVRVKLNGREIAALLAPPWRVVLPAAALQPQNTLELAVTNIAANRIADLDRRTSAWKRFYNMNYPARLPGNRGADGNFSAASWRVRAAGLSGPVSLTPLTAFTPTP